MRQRAAASLLYQSKYAEAAFRNLLKLIFLKIVGRILAFYTCEISFNDIQRIVVIVFCMCVVGKVDRCSLNGLKAAIDKLFKEVGGIDNQVVLHLEE